MLAAWVRERLWPVNDWRDELGQLRQEMTGERSPTRLHELACATEACDPERGRALALYVEASRAGNAAARARAKQLATILRAHLTLAELALADGDLLAAGCAFLDAGFEDLAVEPLARFVETRPVGASVMTEALRLEGVAALLGFARRHRVDAERELASALTSAQHATGAAAAASYLHAERVARIGKLADRIPGIVAAAWRTCPADPAVALMVQTHLFEGANTDALLAHFREHFERAAGPAAYAERVCAAGVELIARNLQPGMGLRLLRLGLESAYDAAVPAIHGHLAMWELLRAHARHQDSNLELAPLIARALAAPIPDDDVLYLTRLGLEIAWRDAADLEAARPYAETVLGMVPDHPLASAFARDHAPGLLIPALPEPRVPPIAPPAAPPAEKQPAKSTSRIPAIDQGQVKRTPAPPPSGGLRITGRLALLKAAPPIAKTAPPPMSSTARSSTTSPPDAPPPSAPMRSLSAASPAVPPPSASPAVPPPSASPAVPPPSAPRHGLMRRSRSPSSRSSRSSSSSVPLPRTSSRSRRPSSLSPASESARSPRPSSSSLLSRTSSSRSSRSSSSSPSLSRTSSSRSSRASSSSPSLSRTSSSRASSSSPSPQASSSSPPSSRSSSRSRRVSSSSRPSWAIAAVHLAEQGSRSGSSQPETRPAPRAFPVPTRSATGPMARAPRKVLPIDVVVELPGGAFFTTVLRDVSTSGAFVVTKRSLDIEAVISLELRIPVPGSTHEASYRTAARIARCTGLGWGLAFVDPSPELVAALRAATG